MFGHIRRGVSNTKEPAQPSGPTWQKTERQRPHLELNAGHYFLHKLTKQQLASCYSPSLHLCWTCSSLVFSGSKEKRSIGEKYSTTSGYWTIFYGLKRCRLQNCQLSQIFLSSGSDSLSIFSSVVVLSLFLKILFLQVSSYSLFVPFSAFTESFARKYFTNTVASPIYTAL